MAERGKTGLVEYQGIIQEDFLREWRGKEAYKRANEMRLNSPVIGALLSAIEQAIRKVTWTLSSDVENDPRLMIWDEQVRRLKGGFGNWVSEALTMLPFGFSVFEIVWTRFGDMVIAGKIAPRSQDTVYRWLLDDTGEFAGLVQQAPPTYALVELPAEKVIHLATRSEKQNPEGRSILRSAWVPYYYAKNIMMIEAIGIERDLAGMPVIKLPDGANTSETDTNSDAKKAAKIVRNLRNDEQAGVVLPFGWELELLSTGGSRQFDTDKTITRYENRMLMAALAQFLMLGQSSVGSFALSRDQTDLFNMSVNTTADTIADALNDQLIPRLMRLNGYDAEGLRLDHSPAGDADVAGISAFLQAVGEKITWTVPDEVWLREVAGLPQVSAEEIEIERETRRAMLPQQPSTVTDDGEDMDEDETEETEDEGDELRAETYAARPALEARAKYERKYQRIMAAFFDDELPGILKSVKRLGKHA
jgi:hypothetical protein